MKKSPTQTLTFTYLHQENKQIFIVIAAMMFQIDLVIHQNTTIGKIRNLFLGIRRT
jgi:hypothetical protein